MKLPTWSATLLLGVLAIRLSAADDPLASRFAAPPPSARPWVFWFWINGNISQEGITADLEAMKRVGIGGVLWMEVSGPWWAPEGRVAALSPQWHECFQWAVRECDRLGLKFDMSVDFGYGSGGPHITPELSMQKLYWSETIVEGGRHVSLELPKPAVAKNLSAWLRPGAEISAQVREQVEKTDSYKDVAVLALPAPAAPQARAYRIPEINLKDGTDWRLPRRATATAPPPGAVTPLERVVDLTGRLSPAGRLAWDAPPGKWLILRCGHASNFKMTRPSPAAAVGLECDRLARAGIEAHYGALQKKIFADAGAAAGRALTHVHIDSWEAGGQNWTATFPFEFHARRGYDLRPWLPVLTGRVVGSAELSERFLWDVRTTVSEMIRDNYAGRLRELAQTHGIKLSIEAYGHLCIDNLAYAGASDLPISEFWARGEGEFPTPGGYETSTKVMASAAHTSGKPVVGAEAFTSDRGWRDHPFLLKAMGDKKFCEGLNRVIFHLSAHQPYDNMIPGLTHRKWGEHIQRHNTWWDFSQPWMEYLARCQYLLQQGEFVADVCHWFGEGAPLNVNEMKLEMPQGHDFDFCSAAAVLQMSARNGRLVLPSGASYRYLLLPDSDRMTLPLARKIRELVEGGVRVIGGQRPKGAPGLAEFPGGDTEVGKIAAALWDTRRVVFGKTLAEVFAQDGLKPDFVGANLHYIHRRVAPGRSSGLAVGSNGAAGAGSTNEVDRDSATRAGRGTASSNRSSTEGQRAVAGDVVDIYFVSNQENRPLATNCTFRVAGKRPELWDPETGAIRELPEFTERDGTITVPLRFDPAQSWFVVFRKEVRGRRSEVGKTNWPECRPLQEIGGPWAVRFDARWGGPKEEITFTHLSDWSKHPDPRIHYYSGTATYRTEFNLSPTATRDSSLVLNLGAVEVMAKVRLNGRECGLAWKPPYRVDISGAARAGANFLEIAVVNLWINRLIGDEQLPLDGKWKDFETLLEWPEWFKKGEPRPSGRYTFTSCRHYRKDSPLVPAGLLGPVTLNLVGKQP